MINLVISGGQNGADLAGIKTAKIFGILTGGWMPKGFWTLDGAKPEYELLFNVKEHPEFGYKPRTRANVKDSDGTLRLAFNFKSPGEICTMNAIKDYKKPHFNIDLKNPLPVEEVILWIKENNIQILNIAGNSERTKVGMEIIVSEYLTELFTCLKNS